MRRLRRHLAPPFRIVGCLSPRWNDFLLLARIGPTRPARFPSVCWEWIERSRMQLACQLLGRRREQPHQRRLTHSEVLGFFWTVQLLIFKGEGRTVRWPEQRTKRPSGFPVGTGWGKTTTPTRYGFLFSVSCQEVSQDVSEPAPVVCDCQWILDRVESEKRNPWRRSGPEASFEGDDISRASLLPMENPDGPGNLIAPVAAKKAKPTCRRERQVGGICRRK